MIQDNSFPFFHENQVLSEDHLNSLVTYLEHQDRKSRILDGSGIRWGLNVSLHAAGKTIKLSPGSGSTTQGYLLILGNEITYRYYQEFILPEDSQENYLYHSGDTRIKLYELLENNLDPHDATEENKNAHEINNTLTPAPDITLTLQDMAVILHLEIVTADLTTCKIDHCDNEGFEHQLHWRALLIAKSDLKHLLQEDLGFSETLQQHFHAKYQVHDARIPLPKFNCSNTQSYAQIHQNYLYICKMGFEHLKLSFDRAKTAYQHTFTGIPVDFNADKLGQNLVYYENNPQANGIQYFYDHLKDVALALNEFTNAAFQYQYACSLNRERYPNYLMAGSFRSGDYHDLKDDIFRHYFEPYCRDTASTNAHKQLVNLYKRVNATVHSYRTDFVTKSASDVTQANRLFITPESRHSGKLGDLTQAYYYSNNHSLRSRWNLNNFAHHQPNNIPWYWHRESDEAADWMQDSNHALRFRLDSHNCYHVEGHLGMTKTAFKAAFEKLKKQFGLDIDLEVLEAKHTDTCEYKHPYDLVHELEALYEIQGKKIDCYLTKLFNMFKDDYQVEEDAFSKPGGLKHRDQGNLEKAGPAKDVQLILGGNNQRNALEIVEKLIGKEQDIYHKIELRGLRGKLLGGWYESATPEEKPTIPFSTITVIEKDKSYTFYEYDASVAEAFYKAGEIDKLISMLAALVYSTRKTINEDEIEAGSTTIKGYINDLNTLSTNIAKLIETFGNKEREIQIHKCLLLPIFIGIYQRCWASSFITIKLKYLDTKASILDPITLPQYVHKFREIKHIGGAPVGGTLIVAFKAYNETSLYDDFSNIILPGTWNGYTPKILADYEAYVDDMGQGLTTVSGGRNELIVADFCLPYRCCAGTSSVEYVVFVELKLDMQDEVCNKTDRVQIQFTPDTAIPSGEHVEQDIDGLFYFASAGIEPGPYEIILSLIDKTIKHTIMVFAPPLAAYTVSPENAPDTVDGKNVWTFGANEGGMTYKWYKRVLDTNDNIFEEITDTIINENDYELVKIQRTYALESAIEEPLDFELVLLVTNGPCRVYSKPVRYTYLPDIEWDINPKAFCNDTLAQDLIQIPSDTQLTGLGDLADRIRPNGQIYTINPSGLDDASYTIRMSRPGHDPITREIDILYHPTAALSQLFDSPRNGTKEQLYMTFEASEKGYTYQWFLGGKKATQPNGALETTDTYSVSWPAAEGIHTDIGLDVTNLRAGKKCTAHTKTAYHADPVKQEISITFPAMVCANTGLKPIYYTPMEAEISGADSSTYVKYNKETNEAFFDTAELKPGTRYPIYLLLRGEREDEHPVNICQPPVTTFKEEKQVDEETKQAHSLFIATGYKRINEFVYLWYTDGRQIADGFQYRHDWPPNINSSLKLLLEVKTKECTLRSNEQEFFHFGGGSLHLENLEYHLNTSLTVFESNTDIPKDIKEYVETIILANKEILLDLQPPGSEVDPVYHALTKIDSGGVTRRIGSNLENMNMILDKLNFLEFTQKERKQVETFMKAILASTSEILLAKTKDLDESIKTYDYLTTITPKAAALFNTSETTEVKTKLMGRVKGKTNIIEFIKVVEKI